MIPLITDAAIMVTPTAGMNQASDIGMIVHYYLRRVAIRYGLNNFAVGWIIHTYRQ